MQNILILKTSSLGDIIHTFPLLGYVRRKFPDAKIDWVVEKPFSELVRAHPYVDRTICVNTKVWRSALFKHRQEIKSFRNILREVEYDVVFDLQGNIKSSVILSQVRSRRKVGFGRKTVHEWPNLLFTNKRFDPPPGMNIRQDNLHLAVQYFNDPNPLPDIPVLLNITDEQREIIENILSHPAIAGRKKVIVCPGSAWPNKQLTLDSIKRLIGALDQQSRPGFLFAWGSAQERELAEEIKTSNSLIIDKLPLPVLQHLMNEVDLVVAMDSLPLHLAGTTKTPSMSFFGPSLAAKFKPLGEQHRAYQGACPYGRTFEKRCSILRTCPTGKCMHDLTGLELLD